MELYGRKEAKLQHLHLKGQALSCVLPSLNGELASPLEHKWCWKQVPHGQVPAHVLWGERSLGHSDYKDVGIPLVGVYYEDLYKGSHSNAGSVARTGQIIPMHWTWRLPLVQLESLLHSGTGVLRQSLSSWSPFLLNKSMSKGYVK